MVACTPRTLCAGLGLPSATAAVSSVSRCGKYHSVPSALFTPEPENMAANRVIGVSAPVPFHPWIGPFDARPSPRCAWAAASEGGEVATFRAYPYWPILETRTGGTMSAGRSPEVCPWEGALGSTSAAADPVASNSPAKGAAMPPKVSQGDTDGASSAWSIWVARAAVMGAAAVLEPGPSGVGALAPSMYTRPAS